MKRSKEHSHCSIFTTTDLKIYLSNKSLYLSNLNTLVLATTILFCVWVQVEIITTFAILLLLFHIVLEVNLCQPRIPLKGRLTFRCVHVLFSSFICWLLWGRPLWTWPSMHRQSSSVLLFSRLLDIYCASIFTQSLSPRTVPGILVHEWRAPLPL